MHGTGDGEPGGQKQTCGEQVRALLEARHPEWTRSIVGTLAKEGHDPDGAVEASQMAFVELWVSPELFDATKQAAGSREEGLFRMLKRRATWRAVDLRRRARREEPHADMSDAPGTADRSAVDVELGDLLLEPDDSYWIGMNTTKYRYGSRCHTEAISRCLAGESQRSVALAFEMSAPTLNRQIAYFKARFAMLGARGRPRFDVAHIRCLRRRGCQLVVMAESEVEGDGALSPRVRLPDDQGDPGWICEVIRSSEEGGSDG